jgi:hypothetical protein
MVPVLRILTVVGVIFYLSPVRQAGDGMPSPVRPTLRDVATASPLAQGLEALWQRLPAEVARSIVERLSSTLAQSPAAKAASERTEKPATDTLEPEDLRPPWRGEARKPGR